MSQPMADNRAQQRLTDDAEWQSLLAARYEGAALPRASTPQSALYSPLIEAGLESASFVIGHLAQSLDGRIATVSGVSQWLSGDADLLHTHRMRALADAVLVGAGTVLHDNPQLSVRHCDGPNPLRIVIDPERRLDGTQRVFQDNVSPTLLLVAEDRVTANETCGNAEVVGVPRGTHGLDPQAILLLLQERGLTWLFVEGGGVTVSRFLAAGALDRLQITVAPVILGSGRPSVSLPEITDLSDSLRPRTRRFDLDGDIMIECDFS